MATETSLISVIPHDGESGGHEVILSEALLQEQLKLSMWLGELGYEVVI